MYMMCVLCFLSALSHEAGALQIFIVIIMNIKNLLDASVSLGAASDFVVGGGTASAVQICCQGNS